jgi:hypothetical protein
LGWQAEASNRGGLVLSITKFVRMLLQSLILGVGAYLVIQRDVSAGMMIAASIIICRAVDLLLNHYLAMRAEPFNFGFFKLYIVGGIVMVGTFCIYPLHEFVNTYFLYTVPLILFLISSFLLLHKDIRELVHTYQSNLKTAAIQKLVEEA